MTERAVVVVTRFAVDWPAGTWPVGRRPADSAVTKLWVLNRFHLLSRLAAPALARTRRPVWWVWLAEPRMVDFAEGLARNLPDHRITVTTPDRHTARMVAPHADRFLTFRLDSDDTFLSGAISWAARRSWPVATLIDFACGFQHDTQTGHWQLLRTRRTWQGPFLAVTHETRDTMLDFGGHHVTEARTGRTVRRVRRPSWIQTVHDTNIINRMVALHPAQWRRNQNAVPLPDAVGRILSHT